MKVAIVGTSHLTYEEIDKANNAIESIFNAHPDDTEYFTGDANGIDGLVLSYSKNHHITMIKALENKWEGKYGYKARNMRIADEVDYVYSITTKTKNEKCYHCHADHQRTGGCWTKFYAVIMGKDGKTIVI